MIRPIEPKDAAGLVEVRSSPEVARYQTWTAFTAADAEALVAAMRGRTIRASGRWYQLAIAARQDDWVVGDLALRFPVDDPSQAEIGFNVARKHWRKGYGREAVATGLGWLHAHRGVRRVFAVADERNHPSRRLLESCGFSAVKGGWRMVFFKGEWAGEMVYERLLEEGRATISPR